MLMTTSHGERLGWSAGVGNDKWNADRLVSVPGRSMFSFLQWEAKFDDFVTELSLINYLHNRA